MSFVRIAGRCLLISLVAAVLGPTLTMTISISPGDEVLDISDITAEELDEATREEAYRLVEERAVRREITGTVDILAYVFSHPQISWFYWEAALAIFCLVFPATLIASAWNLRTSSRG